MVQAARWFGKIPQSLGAGARELATHAVASEEFVLRCKAPGLRERCDVMFPRIPKRMRRSSFFTILVVVQVLLVGDARAEPPTATVGAPIAFGGLF
jgi:hypothetical protein